MDKAGARAVNIVPGHEKAALSDGQRLFNTLTGQIEARRARLRAWEVMQTTFHKQYVDELLPLVRESTGLQVKMVHRLNDAYDDRSLSKAERLTLSDLIARMATRLVEDSDDAGLRAILNMHGGPDDADGDVQPVASARTTQAGAEDANASGRAADDGDASGRAADAAADSPDELLDYEQAQEQARLAREAAKDKARAARKQAQAEKNAAKQAAKQASEKPAAPSPQQQAAALLEAAQAEASKSMREVYRKLASALHPDREPDPEERVRKTALMQEANRAYEKKDLLRLLELRLELEHIDQQAINGINEDRLKHYNQILQEQLGDLDEEIRHLEDGFRRSYGIRKSSAIEPDTILRILRKDVAGLRDQIRDMAVELRLLEDIERLKAWLGHLKIHMKTQGR
ncbi:J domain-containing protein [Bordetella sp. N]|uniref:J domain-containing protein n=1 Tax=Bordetella sp. N TaxID=1746199 RepID=UPI00070F6A31|nr:J domain-containing protein [Bordetella sp. N]ALM83244.1 hypothetical protein ASB57_09935 [Bordetella sp. N]